MVHRRVWGEGSRLLSHPIQKLFALFVLVGALFFVVGTFPELFSSEPAGLLLLLLIAASAVYAVALIARVLVEHLVARPFGRLLNADNIVSLVGSYALFIFGILILVSLSFMVIRYLGWGYITYGACGDSFTPEMAAADARASSDYFYFAAVTFFSVGYGDICPMGASKLMAIATAFIGNAVTVVLMGIVLALYLNRKAGAQ